MSDPLLSLSSGDGNNLPVQAALTYPEPAGSRPAGFDIPAQEDGGLQLHRIVAALKRYKWLIMAITAAGTALGTFATRFLPLTYATGATIWVAAPVSNNNTVRSTEILGGQGYSELVRSFNVLEAVVQQQRLYVMTDKPSLFAGLELGEGFKTGSYHLSVSPDGRTYTLMTDRDSVLERGSVGDSIGLPFGFRWQPAPTQVKSADVKFSLVAPRSAAVKLGQRLKVSLPNGSNFMRLELTDDDPVRATTALNGVVDHFMVVASELKAYKLRENARTLDEQSKSVYKELRSAEERLEKYRTDIITLPTDQGAAIAGGLVTQPTITTRYLADKIELDELTRQRDALMAQLAMAQAGQVNLTGLLVIPAVSNSPELKRTIEELTSATTDLATLLTRYTDSSRQVIDMRARLSELRDRELPRQIGLAVESINTTLGAKSEYLQSAAAEIKRIPARMIQEQRYDRERLSLQGLYTDLQARYQAARLAEATAIPDVKVIDRAAQPQFPSSNKAPQLILGAFVASFGAAIGLAILLDKTDKRVLYPQQVSQNLGLSILGAIPAIKRSRNGELSAEQAAQFIEAFRTIRVNLAHLFNSTGQITMTVSSPSPGDGKSLTSSNLAVSFAVAGYRTVLIDGDIRRGELHRMFNLDRKPGLLDYLQGEARLEDIVRPSNQPGLWIIPCGTRRQHGPELLGSSAMQQLLEDLRMRYNAVILDSPPLAAGVDSFVLGSATGNLMLVLRAGETDRHLAEAKLTLVDRLPIRVLGAVLNDVRTKDDAYRYYSYAYGYSAEEEQEPAFLPAGGTGPDRG
jgi:capsular exopolysaccharide synthesis family protein